MRPMRMRRVGAVCAPLLLMFGCGQADGVGASTAPEANIALSLDRATIAISHGYSAPVRISVERTGSFAGSVELAVTGAPTGMMAKLSPSTLPAGATASSLTVSIAPTMEVGTSGTLTVSAHGEGLPDQTVRLGVFVAPLISISLRPDWVCMVPGGSTAVTVVVARPGGFDGTVDLSTTEVPNGLAASIDVPSVDGTSSGATLRVAAAPTLKAEWYEFTVQASVNGVLEQSEWLGVEITSAANNWDCSVWWFWAGGNP